MKKTFFSAIMMIGACAAVQAQEVASPDGRLKVAVGCEGGVANYSVVLDEDTVICRSALGLKTSIGDYTQGLTMGGVIGTGKVSETYMLPNAKKASISYEANEATYSFKNKDGRHVFDVVMHVDNANVAFKYIVKPQNGRGGDRKSCLVEKEATDYVLPEGTTTFICPQMTPQTGFARTAPSYETFYEYDAEMGKNGHGRGYTFPALFKVSANSTSSKMSKKSKTAAPSNIWLMLNETNVGGNYCGSRIECTGKRSYGIAYPEMTEFGGVGSSAPGIMLDGNGGETPWRTITVGRDLKPIAETTIQWDLVKPQYEAKYDYKYGRSAWSWIIRMDASCNYDEQKEYVDFAAAMGWEYLLVDALWDTNIGYERMEQLSKYAQSKGVSLFLWYNSNGYWNDAPQGPRGKMHRLIDRRKEMAWLQKAGIKGLKIDFVGSDKQQTMQMYEDILADANDFGLMIIFHGCTLQRGWERMYPNFISCEAVRASENLAFGQNDNDIEALAGTIHPVLRNAVGNMDFGGSALNKHYSKNNERGTTRKTSDVYALATAILFQTPVQNFAVAPNNMTDAPAWAIDFMKAVPVEWQDMKFIDGYPGKYVVMARQDKQGKWYVAAINAQDEPLTLNLKLAEYFPVGTQVALYTDEVQLVSNDADKNANKTNDKNKADNAKKTQLVGSVKDMKVTTKATKIIVPKNGGMVVK